MLCLPAGGDSLLIAWAKIWFALLMCLFVPALLKMGRLLMELSYILVFNFFDPSPHRGVGQFFVSFFFSTREISLASS